MQIAAAKGIAKLIPDNELTPTNIIPDPFQEGVAKSSPKASVTLSKKQIKEKNNLTPLELGCSLKSETIIYYLKLILNSCISFSI